MEPTWQQMFQAAAVQRGGGQVHLGNRADRYVQIQDLGSGQYGVAKLCQDKLTGEQVAIKFLKRGKPIASTESYVRREILNHRRLGQSPYIVQWKEVFLTKEHLAIVMEYASGGELFDKIAAAGQFNEDVARYFFQQLISGVAWCHSKGICHRDLKLENNLLDRPVPNSAVTSYAALMQHRPRLKICDFGFARSSELDSQAKSLVGTPAYLAPEVLSGREYNGCLADVWSCGVTLYVMLVGAYPFEDPVNPRNQRKALERIALGQYSIPSDVRLSRACLDLLAGIFVVHPKRRITLEQIQRHPWFVQNLPPEMQAVLPAAPPPQEEGKKKKTTLRGLLRFSPKPSSSKHAQQAAADSASQLASSGSGDSSNGGDRGGGGGDGQGQQSEEEIKQIVREACAAAEEPIQTEEVFMEDAMPLSKDHYFDSICGDLMDAELMTMASKGGGQASVSSEQPPSTPAQPWGGPQAAPSAQAQSQYAGGGQAGDANCMRPGLAQQAQHEDRAQHLTDPDLAYELADD